MRQSRRRVGAGRITPPGSVRACGVMHRRVGKPGVSTGKARSVSYSSAVLTGTVTPNGSNTSYYFQYGPTRAYGSQSAIADAGSGTHPVNVRIAIGGLQPITIYHYRLVAVNAAGASVGADHALLTT